MNEKNCGIWFWIEKGAEKEFLTLRKAEGCRWINGEEIDINAKLSFNRIAVKDKVMSYIPASAWLASEFRNVHRVRFQSPEEQSEQ